MNRRCAISTYELYIFDREGWIDDTFCCNLNAENEKSWSCAKSIDVFVLYTTKCCCLVPIVS